MLGIDAEGEGSDAEGGDGSDGIELDGDGNDGSEGDELDGDGSDGSDGDELDGDGMELDDGDGIDGIERDGMELDGEGRGTWQPWSSTAPSTTIATATAVAALDFACFVCVMVTS